MEKELHKQEKIEKAEKIVIMFDIDNTIVTTNGKDYSHCIPKPEMLSLINELYNAGYIVNFFTSRFIGKNNGDIIEAYKEGYESTLKQLKNFGFKFHNLYLGKPGCHIFIDDKNLFHNNDPLSIRKELFRILETKDPADIY